MIKSIIKAWFTGALYLLALAGYSFYAVLWTIRFMQTRKKVSAIIAAAFILLIAAAVYFFVPLHRGGAAIDLTVERGTSLRSIGRTLAQEGVVPSSTLFILWMKLAGEESKVQAGRFVVYKGEGVVAVSRALLHATPIEITVTVPEGLTIEQTASIMARVVHADSAGFVLECMDTAVLREGGINAPSCEGYLFPDTYRFAPDATSRDIVRRMIAHFHEMSATLRHPAAEGGQGQSVLTIHEYVILASIVEREAELASERKHISGVFHNRLDKKIPLGADPTIRYALRKYNGPLFESELAMDSPYNTRKRAGLPPGPICSPGFASLAAAMDPMQTKDLYFVAKWDGSGAHDFSVTNEEHTRKKIEIRRMNDLRLKANTAGKEKGKK
jgi:UPF0755 protein